MAIFKGAGVAIVTPMYEDGKVNFEQLEHIVDWQIENGTDAIIICGTTGMYQGCSGSGGQKSPCDCRYRLQ